MRPLLPALPMSQRSRNRCMKTRPVTSFTADDVRRIACKCGRGVPILPVLVAALAVACGSAPPTGTVAFTTIDADPAWSPAGRLIAFVSNRGFGTTHFRPGVYVIHRNGHSLRRLVAGAAASPTWSPDGKSIAFARADGIYRARADGTGVTRILRGARFSLPAWSPDGGELAVVGDEPDLTTAVYGVHADGTRLHRLSPRRGGSDTEPAWSPDGRRLAVVTDSERIAVVDLAGGRSRV